MKKTIWFVLALAILVIAPPAQARDHHRGNDRHRQYHQQRHSQPVFGPGFLGLMRQNQMMTSSMVYGIFNPQPVYMESYYGSSRRSPEEELARCVGRILKDARKNHQVTTVEQAGAICSGQPIPAVATPEPQPQKALPIPVSNQVGERVCVDGKPHEAYEVFTIDPTGAPVIRTLTGGTCLEAGFAWTDHHTKLNLICTKKGK